MKRLYLVRHGETEWNAGNKVQGSIDIPLSEKGRAQAKLLAGYLKNLPRPQKIFSSTLSRAQETAEIIAGALELENPEANPLLREIDCGEWEGRTFDELLREYPKEYAMWRMSSSYKCPGGESVEDVRERITRFFLEAGAALPETVLMVTHGLFNRAMLSFIMDLPLQQCRHFEQDNGALNVFIWGHVMPHLAAWNFTPEPAEGR